MVREQKWQSELEMEKWRRLIDLRKFKFVLIIHMKIKYCLAINCFEDDTGFLKVRFWWFSSDFDITKIRVINQ